MLRTYHMQYMLGVTLLGVLKYINFVCKLCHRCCLDFPITRWLDSTRVECLALKLCSHIKHIHVMVSVWTVLKPERTKV